MTDRTPTAPASPARRLFLFESTALSLSGVAVLIVEQDAVKTLRLADRAYVLESGEVTLQGTGSELLEDPKVRSAYLGL